MTFLQRPALILLAASLLAIAVYWPGLSGPFLFDDQTNFTVIQAWLEGKASTQQVILGHQSLFFARPLAMMTFLLSAAVGGGDGFYFKLGNLLVHLACSALIFTLLRRALAEDSTLSARAGFMASLLAALWLLHPLHVSTVLYAVQRMAQLSALFALACVWVYFVARRQLIAGKVRQAAFHFFISFPAILALGMLCKQNTAVAPALCAVCELAYFQGKSKPSHLVRSFFVAFLLLPALALATLLLLRPATLLGDYALYDFNLTERLLTQPRALMDYLGQLLLPRGPLMGLYTDDFAVSKSLLSPASTLYATLALAAISLLAIGLRRRSPSFFAGWFFFLVAHSMESSFLPLDLYFEHRNYLPSVGILLAVTGLLSFIPTDIKTNVLDVGQLTIVVATGLILVFAFGTFSRTQIWKDKQSIVDQGLRNHPYSMRANLDMASMLFNQGNISEHDAVLHRMTRSQDPRQRFIGRIYLVTSRCVLGQQGRSTELNAAIIEPASKMTLTEVYAFTNLANASRNKGCGEITPETIADSIVQTLDSSHSQPPTAQSQWLLRYQAALLYANAGHWQQAQQQAELAWQPNADPGVGAHLAQVYAQNGHYDLALSTLRGTAARTKCHDLVSMTTLGHLWIAIDTQRSAGTRKTVLPPALACRQR